MNGENLGMQVEDDEGQMRLGIGLKNRRSQKLCPKTKKKRCSESAQQAAMHEWAKHERCSYIALSFAHVLCFV